MVKVHFICPDDYNAFITELCCKPNIGDNVAVWYNNPKIGRTERTLKIISICHCVHQASATEAAEKGYSHSYPFLLIKLGI
jgi:hypothetical protein